MADYGDNNSNKDENTTKPEHVTNDGDDGNSNTQHSEGSDSTQSSDTQNNLNSADILADVSLDKRPEIDILEDTSDDTVHSTVYDKDENTTKPEYITNDGGDDDDNYDDGGDDDDDDDKEYSNKKDDDTPDTIVQDNSAVISVDLPLIFSTPYRPDLIHKVYVNLESHSFQPQGRHPTAGMDVVADSNDPPTGRGISRVARATGGGGRRRGEGAEVASTRGGRQAHPPTSQKVIYKQINKKEKRLALCSAVASTASEYLISSRGHKINSYTAQYGQKFPIVVNDNIANYTTTRNVVLLLERLNLMQDVNRLYGRKARSGRPSLRGRSKKAGKSILFVVHDHAADLKNAIGSLPGVDAKAVSELSVLDLAPGATAARLTIYTESAIAQLDKIKSTHLQTIITPEVRAQ